MACLLVPDAASEGAQPGSPFPVPSLAPEGAHGASPHPVSVPAPEGAWSGLPSLVPAPASEGSQEGSPLVPLPCPLWSEGGLTSASFFIAGHLPTRQTVAGSSSIHPFSIPA